MITGNMTLQGGLNGTSVETSSEIIGQVNFIPNWKYVHVLKYSINKKINNYNPYI